jgi:hypothetical protein
VARLAAFVLVIAGAVLLSESSGPASDQQS